MKIMLFHYLHILFLYYIKYEYGYLGSQYFKLTVYTEIRFLKR